MAVENDLRMPSPETLRKVLILLGMGLSTFMETFILGHGVSMVAALYADNEKLHLTDDVISWIIAVVFAPMSLGGITATVITERFGRRLTLALFNTPIAIYWIALYYARDGNVFILCRLLAGFCFGGTIPTIYVSTTEYSSPKKRDANFTFVSAMGPLGGIVGQFFGLVLHWRTAALVAIVPAVLTALLPLFYVESPQWLASRGRFDDCEVAFRALHGYKSEKELQLLIEVEKCKFNEKETKAQIIVALMRKLKSAATKRYFWNIMVLGYVIQLYKIVCGFVLKGIMGVTILQHITGETDVLRFTILVDGLTLLGSAIGYIIISKIRSRILIFTGGAMNNIVLIIFSILLYYNYSNSTVLSWVKTFLFGLHCFVLNVSIYPLLELIPQLMFPLELKTTCTTIIAFFSSITLVVYSKTIPSLFVQVDYYGVYTLNVVIMCLCLLFFWKKIPETKGRTLQEIELYFKNNKFVSIDDLLTNDQMKSLV